MIKQSERIMSDEDCAKLRARYIQAGIIEECKNKADIPFLGPHTVNRLKEALIKHGLLKPRGLHAGPVKNTRS